MHAFGSFLILLASLKTSHAAQFEFVSQSFEGACTQTTDGEDTGADASLDGIMDLKKLKVRNSVAVKNNVPQDVGGTVVNVSIEVISEMIYDQSEKTLTFHAVKVINGNHAESCLVFDVAKEAKEVTDCLSTTAAALKKDGDTVTIQPGLQWQVDDKSIIKKIITTNVGWQKKTTVLTCTAKASSKAGIPPAEVFEVPKSWGSCSKATFDAVPNAVLGLIPLANPFRDCLGVPKPKESSSAFASIGAVKKDGPAEKWSHAKKAAASQNEKREIKQPEVIV